MTSSSHDEPRSMNAESIPPSVFLENASIVPCDDAVLVELACFTLQRLSLHPQDELSIRIVDEQEMAELHLTWMQEPGPTDVLSFPMDELRPMTRSDDRNPGMLGDIVLCPAFALRQARAEGKAEQDLPGILQMLLVHGVLHLVGHDHATEQEYAQMFSLQDALLGAWRHAHPAVETR